MSSLESIPLTSFLGPLLGDCLVLIQISNRFLGTDLYEVAWVRPQDSSSWKLTILRLSSEWQLCWLEKDGCYEDSWLERTYILEPQLASLANALKTLLQRRESEQRQ